MTESTTVDLGLLPNSPASPDEPPQAIPAPVAHPFLTITQTAKPRLAALKASLPQFHPSHPPATQHSLPAALNSADVKTAADPAIAPPVAARKSLTELQRSMVALLRFPLFQRYPVAVLWTVILAVLLVSSAASVIVLLDPQVSRPMLAKPLITPERLAQLQATQRSAQPIDPTTQKKDIHIRWLPAQAALLSASKIAIAPAEWDSIQAQFSQQLDQIPREAIALSLALIALGAGGVLRQRLILAQSLLVRQPSAPRGKVSQGKASRGKVLGSLARHLNHALTVPQDSTDAIPVHAVVVPESAYGRIPLPHTGLALTQRGLTSATSIPRSMLRSAPRHRSAPLAASNTILPPKALESMAPRPVPMPISRTKPPTGKANLLDVMDLRRQYPLASLI